MVSKQLHCLNDLLFRTSTGDLQIEIPLVVSNHLDAEPMAESYGVDVPAPPGHPRHQGGRRGPARSSWSTTSASTWSCWRATCRSCPTTCAASLSGRAINIHHSFLPSFKGAKPYHQAYERGVKLIGATAHYVTADLDEGPIIEQDVTRVDHTLEPRRSSSPSVATSRRRCSRARCAGTPRPGCCSTATARWSSG